MNALSFLFTTSRPRMWGFLCSVYTVGYIFGVSSMTFLTSPLFWLLFFYFLFPANVFLYGVSDFFDNDNNKKKQILKKILKIVGFGSLIFGYFLFPDPIMRILFGLFLFLSFFYSGAPLRFKVHPIIDAASNILYALPGFLGYYVASGSFPPLWAITAAWCWIGSMYVFSCIRDTVRTKKTNLETTAVVLGKEQALMLCIVLWSVCSIILFMQRLDSYLIVLSIIYPLVPLFLLYREEKELKKLSWIYPFLNALAVFGLFAMAISHI